MPSSSAKQRQPVAVVKRIGLTKAKKEGTSYRTLEAYGRMMMERSARWPPLATARAAEGRVVQKTIHLKLG
jgi:hypothetical protein